MGIFNRPRRNRGLAMYSPMAGDAAWQPSPLRSPGALPGHAVLRQREGKITRLDTPQLSSPFDRYQQVDLRRRLIQVHPQRVPTADAMTVTVTLAMSVRTTDPVAFASNSQGPDEEIYLAAQIALRELVATLGLEEFIGTRIDLGPVLDAAKAAGAAVGVEVASVMLKDVSLPAQYSDALAQAMVSKVNSEADLERARNEVKTTRARLASAKVLEQNPVLAKIRMIEALPPGSTLEVRNDAL